MRDVRIHSIYRCDGADEVSTGELVLEERFHLTRTARCRDDREVTTSCADPKMNRCRGRCFH